jgi:hypothetical protein
MDQGFYPKDKGFYPMDQWTNGPMAIKGTYREMSGLLRNESFDEK